MAPVNILIFIHGMNPTIGPGKPDQSYDDFWRAMVASRGNLPDRMDKIVYVRWGHDLGMGGALRDDEKLMKAQNVVSDRTAYDAVRTHPGPNNVLLSGFFGQDYSLLPLRCILFKLREETVLRGVGDAIYYASEDGERQVRRVVYDQALKPLNSYLNKSDVRFHLIGNSLGVTLTHDFLYGLFASNHTPDFASASQGTQAAVCRFNRWREKAQQGELTLGTLISSGSQLPLLHMRKQALVNRFFQEKYLDPAAIGVTATGHTQWLLFYDIDDVLGFPTRELYSPNHAIKEIQVDSGDNPETAHSNYWGNATVIRESARQLFENTF